MMRVIIFWFARTAVATFVRHSAWAWAVLEIVHVLGLSMLLGTVGLFDLRLMGYAKQIPPKALHRARCSSSPARACTSANIAFEIKLVLLVLAAINVAAFYLVMRRPVLALEAGGITPLPARIIGGLSLVIWISVLVAGRMEAFFKPLLQ